MVGIINFFSDADYFEKIKDIRSIIESEIGLTQNYISIVHYSNVEIIALILGILAIFTYFTFDTLVILCVLIGPFIIYQTLQSNSGMENLKIQLGLQKIRCKKKINELSNFDIDIPIQYRRFSDISLLIQKICLVKFDTENGEEVELTNNFLWANTFSMNAFNNQMGYWVICILTIICYFYCIIHSLIQVSISFIVFGIVQLVSFYYVTALEGNLRFFVTHNFKRNFLIFHIAWIMSIICYYGILLITYFRLIPEFATLHNILLLGIVGLLMFFIIMLCNDFFSSSICSGIMNDKLNELVRLRNEIDTQIIQKKRLVDDPDSYYYDCLVMKRYKVVKWRFVLFGKYIFEPDLTENDIKILSKSPLHYERLQGEIGMLGSTIKNKEILKRYGYRN
jgi:hypothetical protein